MRSSLIAGASGAVLTAGERDFYAEARPAGFILFARNCASHDQIRKLIDDVRSAVGADDFLVLIDQEGGRVQRLRPPLGRALPPAIAYGRAFERGAPMAVDAARDVARLMAADLKELGINCVCAPVLDLPVAGAHEIIGDRAYGTAVEQIVPLARAVGEGFIAGGVVPVIKHIPGHGRATADSHLALPVVDTPHGELLKTDFAPFKALADMPAAMTAHVVFSSLDAEAPASTSKLVTDNVMRGEIGFDGLLMSDDLSMKALDGAMRARAEAVIAAGSDVALHCNGELAEMVDAAAGVPAMSGKSLDRFIAACAITMVSEPFDQARSEAALTAILGS